MFGYDNSSPIAEGKKSHVERRINEAEAAIVREIFDRYASGWGYARIAKTLNAIHASSPRPTEHKPPGWSPSSVRCILRRDLYRGIVTWNRSQKRDKWGRQRQKARPETEWMTREAPELRIVSDELWEAAQARFARTRTMLATSQGPRAIVRRDIGSPYLLSGFACCATCGWAMTAITRRHTGARARRFIPAYPITSAARPLSEWTALPLEKADVPCSARCVRDALDPRVVAAIIDLVFDQLAPERADTNLEGLQRHCAILMLGLSNLTAAIEHGAALDPLVAQLHDVSRNANV